MQNSMTLCQNSPTGQEQDWRDLYEKSFPADERTPMDELLQLLAAGSILLHRTVNKDGELLCFTIVYPLSNFTLLSYIATDQNKRSTGVGSKHMKRLIEILKEKYPHHRGLFLEIESTRERGIDAGEQKTRTRRLAFYQRLGAKRLCRTYVWPSYGAKGAYRLAELLWIDFDPGTVDDIILPGVIKEMYTKAYLVPEDDPLLSLILLQFTCGSKVPLKEMVCAVESSKGDKTDAAATATDTGDGKKDAAVVPDTGQKDESVQDVAADKPAPAATTAEATVATTEPVATTDAPASTDAQAASTDAQAPADTSVTQTNGPVTPTETPSEVSGAVVADPVSADSASVAPDAVKESATESGGTATDVTGSTSLQHQAAESGENTQESGTPVQQTEPNQAPGAEAK